MNTYRFLSPAEEELAEAALYYDAQAEGLGHDFLDNVQHVIDLLCEHPHLGPPFTSPFRAMVLSRFPFNLIYTFETEGILIVAVAHHKRGPDYWKSRIRK